MTIQKAVPRKLQYLSRPPLLPSQPMPPSLFRDISVQRSWTKAGKPASATSTTRRFAIGSTRPAVHHLKQIELPPQSPRYFLNQFTEPSQSSPSFASLCPWRPQSSNSPQHRGSTISGQSKTSPSFGPVTMTTTLIHPPSTSTASLPSSTTATKEHHPQ